MSNELILDKKLFSLKWFFPFFVLQLAIIFSIFFGIYLLPVFLILVGLIIFIVNDLERSLYLIPLSMAFSQSLPAFNLGVRAVGTSFDYILLPIIIVAWLIRKVLACSIPPKEKKDLKAPAILFTLLALFSLGLASFHLRATELLDGILPLLSLSFYLFLPFVIADIVKTPQQIKRLFYLMFALALAVALIGIIEYLLFAPYRIGSIFGSIFRGIRGNANALGAYLGIFALISLNFIFYSKRGKRIFWSLSFFVFIIGLIMTFSRSSWLGFTIGAIFLIYRSNRRVLVLWIILALLISPVWLPGKVTHRISTIGEAAFNKYLIHKFLNFDYRQIQLGEIETRGIPGYNMEVISAALRYSTWRDGFNIFKRFPLFGSGFRLNKYFGRMLSAENLYLDILASTGIIGFLAFLWLGFRLIRMPRSILQGTREPFHRALSLSYTSILILIAIISITGSILLDPKLLGPFWFLTGLLNWIKNFNSDVKLKREG